MDIQQQARAELARRELARRELARRSANAQAVPGFDAGQQTKKVGEVEKLISERPSTISQNKPGLTPLSAIGPAFEVMEGIPADIGLAAQQAVGSKGESIKKLPMDIVKTLTGKRPAEFGDIYRASNIPTLSSEPVAATGGLLTSASNLTPTGKVGNEAGELIGKLLAGPGRAVRRGVGRVMSALSGVPEKSMQTALENPNVLSKRWLSKEAEAAGQQYAKDVKPLINDPNAVVSPTSKIQSLTNDLGFYTQSGEETRVLSSMTPEEKKAVIDWVQRLDNGQGGISFNDVDKVIAEIDRDMGKFYKASDFGKTPPKTNEFDRVSRQIRGVADEARKSQFPDAGKAIERYANLKHGEVANKNFSHPFPKGMIGKSAIDALIGHFFGGATATGLAVASSPIAQGTAVKIGANLAREAGSKPALFMRDFAKKKTNRGS